jgi:hypothetical protein
MFWMLTPYGLQIFFPFHKLSVHSVNCLLCCVEAFKSLVHFMLIFVYGVS